jgi:hypothetical protein
MCGLHLSQQGGQPAAAAEYRVGHDQIISHREHVQVVSRVRDTVLLPAQRVLDDLGGAIRSPVQAEFIEPGWIGEPAAVLTSATCVFAIFVSQTV